jgi:hypothetical protein
MGDGPIERVTAYIDAYHAAWSELYERVSDDGDFGVWAEAMNEIAEAHCARDGNEIDRYSIGSPPAHDPDVETVLQMNLEDEERAAVLTQSGDYRYFEYELELLDARWRITHIRQTASDPRQPLVTTEKREELLASASNDATFQPLSQTEDPSNSLFEDGRTIESTHGTDTLRVQRVGELNVVSGVLAVQDFGYDAYNLAPLERRVAPGRYPVDVSSVFGRNAALRVCLGDPDDVVSWHPANVPGGGHVCGVDAGNLAVFDLAGFSSLDVRDKERIYETAVVNPSAMPPAEMISMEHDNDGVVAHSGWGDGAYPVHWGVDASGEPVVLLLDFLVACSFPTEVIELQVDEASLGTPLRHPLLDEYEVEIRLEQTDGGGAMKVSKDTSELKIIDDAGDEICNVMWMSSTWTAGRSTYEIPPDVMNALPWRLHVALSKGYRNDSVLD